MRATILACIAVSLFAGCVAAEDRQRVVQFRAAGTMAPSGLSFTKTGRLLATPGCYLFDPRNPADRNR